MPVDAFIGPMFGQPVRDGPLEGEEFIKNAESCSGMRRVIRI